MAEPPIAGPPIAGPPASSLPGAPAPGKEAGDPSMEDILASIRKILSDDEAAAKPPGAEPASLPAATSKDVLLLSEDMMVPDPPPPPPPSRLETLPPGPPPGAPSHRPAEPLVAPATAKAAASSLGNLVRIVAQERSVSVHRNGPTLEDLVREEIRPILREWLDANLPPLVERLVRAEIERVVGRADL